MIYAQIKNGKIENTIVLDEYSELFIEGYDHLIRIDTVEPRPGVNWTYDGNTFAPPESVPVGDGPLDD